MGNPTFSKNILCPNCKGKGFLVVDHEETKEECDSCQGGGNIVVDEFFDDAIEIVSSVNNIGISTLQRKLRIGYNRASYIMEDLQKSGIVSAPNIQGKRELLIVNNSH